MEEARATAPAGAGRLAAAQRFAASGPLVRPAETPDRVQSVPDFTDEQRAWLVDMLTPRCCHVTGEHDSLHFVEQKYVCSLQAQQRYTALRRALGLPLGGDGSWARPPVDEAISDPGCGWCQRETAPARGSS